jgi:hypothetical protein
VPEEPAPHCGGEGVISISRKPTLAPPGRGTKSISLSTGVRVINQSDTINTFNKSLTLINTNLELKRFLLQLIFKNKKEIVIETRFTIFAT